MLASLARTHREQLDTLAAAMARTGDYLGAVLWQKKAIGLVGDDKRLEKEEIEKLKQEFNNRLKLYQKQLPYTEKEPKGDAGAEPLPSDTILQEEGVPDNKPKPKTKPKSGGGAVVISPLVSEAPAV